jgi:apolipoprotein N-acyltransferase
VKPLSLPLAALGAALSGTLYFLGYAGMDVWPLLLFALVPLWISIQGQTPKTAFWLGALNGLVMCVGGFYWLFTMLKVFSGFGTPLCIFFMVFICGFQGLRHAALCWLYARGTRRGHNRVLVFFAANAATELCFPLLFTWYFGAGVHQVPLLVQGADLGGPIFVSLILVAANIGLAEPLLARLERRPVDRRLLVGCAAAFGLNMGYGALRISQTDARMAAADEAQVGIVQGNMGLMQKREDPGEGLRRHKRLTAELKQKGADLVVWSESSVTFAVPEQMYKPFMRDRVSGQLGIPSIFGAVIFRHDKDRERWFNSALAADAQGEVQGRYDKQFLLAFGEYLPFGDTFPILHKWSPNSGKFSKGTSLEPLRVVVKGKERVISTLICYEDISPSFTNAAVNFADPDLLVNITNDAWFGDSTEPWEHLALAKFRAIEHRRYLVRSTNSGVSAIVDANGRVVTSTKTFVAEAALAPVRFMRGGTVYETLGDWPWAAMTLISLGAAFVKRKTKGDASDKK